MLIREDKGVQRNSDASSFDGTGLDASFRRNYLYEDAFEKLSLERGIF